MLTTAANAAREAWDLMMIMTKMLMTEKMLDDHNDAAIVH
jgi:hypothetical protein